MIIVLITKYNLQRKNDVLFKEVKLVKEEKGNSGIDIE